MTKAKLREIVVPLAKDNVAAMTILTAFEQYINSQNSGQANVSGSLLPADAVAFAKWLKRLDNGTEHYNPFTEETSSSIGFSPSDCFDDNIYTVEELYQKFKEVGGNDR